MEQAGDLVADLGVEIRGRLVGQDHRRLVRQRPCDGHPLLLSAGQFGGLEPQPWSEAEAGEKALGRGTAFATGDTGQVEHELDILLCRQRRQQVEVLKDESEPTSPEMGQLRFGQRREVDVRARPRCRRRASDLPGGTSTRLGPALVVPLCESDEVSGVLVTTREGGSLPFTESELALAASFMGQAAMALKLAESHRAESELRVLADRDRIARDLHDQVIQHLYAVGTVLHHGRITSLTLTVSVDDDLTIDIVLKGAGLDEAA